VLDVDPPTAALSRTPDHVAGRAFEEPPCSIPTAVLRGIQITINGIRRGLRNAVEGGLQDSPVIARIEATKQSTLALRL